MSPAPGPARVGEACSGPRDPAGRQLSTTATVHGATIAETLGLVKGNTVRARNVGRDLTQAVRDLTGGELKASSTLMTRSRDEALERMVQAAEEIGADAVVEVRFETAGVAQGAAEILASGTAVELE